MMTFQAMRVQQVGDENLNRIEMTSPVTRILSYTASAHR